jgi:hypothetical protein
MHTRLGDGVAYFRCHGLARVPDPLLYDITKNSASNWPPGDHESATKLSNVTVRTNPTWQ